MFAPYQVLRLLLGLVLVTAAGCGLSEYEDKMRESQRVVDRFDEETHALSGPVEVPQVKVRPKDSVDPKTDISVPMVKLTFRPPIGFAPQAGKNPLGGMLYVYLPAKPLAKPAMPGHPPPPPIQAQPLPSGLLEVGLAWTAREERDKFVQNVLRLFAVKGKILPPQKHVVNLPHREVIQFEVYDFVDPADNWYRVAFRSRGNLHVALVYKGSPSTLGQAQRALQLSMESLAIDDEMK